MNHQRTPIYQPSLENFMKDNRFKSSFREALNSYHEVGGLRNFCCWGDVCPVSGDEDAQKSGKIATCVYAERMGCPFNFTSEQLDSRGKVSLTGEPPALLYETAHTIHGFPFFKAGTFNNVTFTESDLDAMVENFKKLKENVKPVLKFGHGSQKFLKGEGLPALGWVENIYRSGKTLLADIANIPEKVYDLIRKKAYRRPSAEIYKNYEQEGKKYGPVLSAIALLGADAPAIKTLPEIEALFNREGYSDVIALYNSNVDFAADSIEMLEESPSKQYGENLAGFLNRVMDTKMENQEMMREDMISMMARAAGITEGTVGGILRGTITCPPMERLQGFADALDISIDDVVAAAKRDGCEYSSNMAEGGNIMAENVKQTAEELAALEAQKAAEKEQKELESLREKVSLYEAEIETQRQQAEEREKERQLQEYADFISSRKKDGKILPIHEPKIFAILTKLPGDEAPDEMISLQEEGKPIKKVSPLQLFKDVIDSMPNLINLKEISESTKDDKAQKNLDESGYARIFLSEEERSRKFPLDEVELAKKAEVLAAKEKIAYAEALVRVSTELNLS